ncbi:MAG: GNAT family N-acetyltransferase [Ruminiclostridium sp.]|nr:GNAT family N-acetyltransferase [Ruminiclostridium sp.]
MYKVEPIFIGCTDTMVLSCLQGYMGNAWTDNIKNPKSVQIITADVCFFSGQPDLELVKNIPEYFSKECIYMIPQNEEWSSLIEQEYGDKADRFMRYSLKKEPGVFDTVKLQGIINQISPEFTIKEIDEEIYNLANQESWSSDLCAQFPNYDDYKKKAIGFAAILNGSIVSGASSYTIYKDGIEIEIDTKKVFRRRGLALACASKLILECLRRNLYPSWDAANKESVALAEKLGYHFDKEYPAYEVKLSKG